MCQPKAVVLLGRVAVCTAKAIYSRQTFPVTIILSVCLWVCLSNGLWKNGGSDPNAVWHGRSDGSIDEAGSGVWELVKEKG